MSDVALHPLDLISLCAGGGGLDLGVELAIPGARSVVLVEREAFAVAHLVAAMEAGLLAPAPVWSDARTFDGRRWRGLVDGVIGGIPCQPHSLAGRKRGSLDARDLWSPTRRIIAQARPWFVLIENVAGMLAPGDDEIAGAERVWRDLRKLGFAVEGGLFTAAEVGAPHERERLFILGLADTNDQRGRSEQQFRVCDRTRSRQQPPGHRGPVANASSRGQRREGGPVFPPAGIDWRCGALDGAGASIDLFPPGPDDRNRWVSVLARSPHLEPAVCRLVDGMASTRIDWLRLLGNGAVPLQVGHAVRTLLFRHAAAGSAAAARLVRLMEGPA